MEQKELWNFRGDYISKLELQNGPLIKYTVGIWDWDLANSFLGS